MSPRSQGSRSSGGIDSRISGDETTKRRKLSSAKQTAESSSSNDETLSAFPCLVALNPGVRIATVAAGGRHTLALSGTFRHKRELSDPELCFIVLSLQYMQHGS